MTAKKHGGERKGAGRPEGSDPKLPIQFGLEESKVVIIGGKKKTQKIAKELVTKYAENLANENSARTA